MSSYSISSTYKRTLLPTAHNDLHDSYDIVILFHSAEDLPMVDASASTNPYFVAKIDDQISFTSTILSNTSKPKWNNEKWIIRNVPSNAKLSINIYNKNDKKLVDDCIGEFEVSNIINYYSPSGGHVVLGSFGRHNGRFHLSIDSTKSSNETQQLPRYTFDGPCRYSRYDALSADCISSTWRIQLRRILFFFLPNEYQQWNRQYKPTYQSFYERALKHNEDGRLTSVDDLWKLVFVDRITQQIKPRAYNYIIDDDTWQFSEIDHRFSTDSAVKHARLANGSEYLRFAGEFHLRPKFGWNRLDDEWELVFDNASGTYSPNADLLVNLKKLLLFNFPGLNVSTYDHKDPRLHESIEQLDIAARKYKRNSTTTATSKRILPHSFLT